uniref:Uncharacterized protein n=1 Tax=Knipowitschia caucasica TaxID=637954 RepID=A0AAV2JDI2_KNICA
MQPSPLTFQPPQQNPWTLQQTLLLSVDPVHHHHLPSPGQQQRPEPAPHAAPASPSTQRGLPGAGNQHPHSSPCVQQRPGSDPSLDEPAGSGHGHRAPSPRPRPLFAPTTLIVGDSIVRHVRFFNAVTHCITGATVPDLLIRLPPLLQSLPDTISKVIVHVGINDMKLQQSEVTKKHFMDLFRLLQSFGFAPRGGRDCLHPRLLGPHHPPPPPPYQHRRLEDWVGVAGTALSWFRSYLQDRKFFVEIENCTSDHLALTCGVPQGSILGPLLFNIYMLPLVFIMAAGLLVYPFGLNSTLVRSFCGDADIYYAGECQIGWGYMLAIVGVMLTVFLPFFAKYAPKEHLSPTPLPTLL